jgi:hypothetical protein
VYVGRTKDTWILILTKVNSGYVCDHSLATKFIGHWLFTIILLCYNVITLEMPEMFKGKLRRIGNSYGVIVPKKIISKYDVQEGEEILVSIHSSMANNSVSELKKLVGSHTGKSPFERDKGDRF